MKASHARTRSSFHKRRPASRRLVLEALERRSLLAAVPGAALFKPSEILLGFQGDIAEQARREGPNQALDSAAARFGQFGIEQGEVLMPGAGPFAQHLITLWKLLPGKSVTEVAAQLSRFPGIAYAEPNYLWSINATTQYPNDPSFSSLWGLNNTGQSGGAPDADIDAPEAWATFRGTGNVVVGVIDTGVNFNHGDLAANIWTNPYEIAGNAIDDDANGFVDDIHGYDFANNDADPMDDHGHGTHVSGTIGAVGNNGAGVVGVNWNVKLMPLKFLDSVGTGTTANAVRAVNYATQMRNLYVSSGGVKGANIVLTNNSWGGGSSSQSLQDAITASGNAGMLFVAAAGNDGRSRASYPARYPNDNIISVAATDHYDQLADFSGFGPFSWGSNYGPDVDIGAPGVGIYSTYGSAYSTLDGTSMATPHVAGAAALVWDYLQSWGDAPIYQTVRDALFQGGDPTPGLADKVTTGSRLNANGALLRAAATLGATPRLAIVDATVMENAKATAAGYFVAPDAYGVAAARALSLGPDGNFYLANHDTDVVKVFSQTGEFLDDLGTAAGELDGPWGMVFGPDGYLYVGGRYSHNIVRFDIATGAYEEFVSAATGGGLLVPRSLAFGPDGNLYASSRMEGAPTTTDVIKRYAGATGAYLGDFVTASSGGLNNAYGIAFGPDGNLYVVSATTSEIKRYDGLTGAFLDNFIAAGLGGLTNASQIVFHTDGHLYVASQSNQQVLRYETATGVFVDVFASGLGQTPAGLAFAPTGDLYVSLGAPAGAKGSGVLRVVAGAVAVNVSLSVASTSTITVDYVTVNGTALAGDDYAATSGTLTFPPGVTSRTVLVKVTDDLLLESNETFGLYLSNPTAGTIIADADGLATIQDDEFQRQVSISDTIRTEGDRTPHYRGAFVDDGVAAGGHYNPITFGPDGNLYTAVGTGPGYNSIRRYSGATGDFLDTFVPVGLVNGVREIVFRNGHVYVASAYTNEVLRYDATTGAFVDVFVTAGSGGVEHPNGMAFGPDANHDGVPELYVSGTISDSVVRYDGLTGLPLGTFIQSGSGGLVDPFAFAFGSGGIFVTSAGTDQILKYNGETGAFLGVAASAGIDGPKDVEFGPDGFMYVASGNNDRVVRFTAAGAFVDDFVPAGGGGLDNPTSLAFGSDGDLYVTATGNREVLRFGTELEAVFTVSLVGVSDSTVSINYAAANGSATAGNDYTVASGTLSFAPGVTTRVMRVPLLDDAIYEGNETLIVNLSSPSPGAFIFDAQGVGTIIDNELPPTKFYIVNDGSPDRTYEYAATGIAVENYALSNTAPRGAASTAAGSQVWVVDANRKVYVYNASGGLVSSWTAGTLTNKSVPEGIATNGTDIWIVDNNTDKVYKYNAAASQANGTTKTADSSFTIAAGNTNPKDIVTDGINFWVVDDGSGVDKVFKYTVAGVLVGSWTIDSANTAPTGITIDPANVSDIWIVDSGTDTVYQYTAAASRTSGSQGAAMTFALVPGNTNPQGIADPPESGTLSETSVAAAVDVGIDERPGTLPTSGAGAKQRKRTSSPVAPLISIGVSRSPSSSSRTSQLNGEPIAASNDAEEAELLDAVDEFFETWDSDWREWYG